jgi:DNA anti-recombination protein RmuC
MDESYIIGLVSDNSRDIQTQKDQISKFEMSLGQFQKSIDNLMNVFSSIRMDLAKLESFPSDILGVKSQLGIVLSTIENLQSNFSFQIRSIKDEFQQIKDSHGSLKGFVDGLDSQVKNTDTKSEKFNEDILGKLRDHDNILSKLQDIEENIKFWVTSKLDENKPLDMTNNLENFKSELLKILEIVKIESQNAFLKAGNISMQIPMLEKKIENIVLTLKKYDLNQ